MRHCRCCSCCCCCCDCCYYYPSSSSSSSSSSASRGSGQGDHPGVGAEDRRGTAARAGGAGAVAAFIRPQFPSLWSSSSSDSCRGDGGGGGGRCHERDEHVVVGVSCGLTEGGRAAALQQGLSSRLSVCLCSKGSGCDGQYDASGHAGRCLVAHSRSSTNPRRADLWCLWVCVWWCGSEWVKLGRLDTIGLPRHGAGVYVLPGRTESAGARTQRRGE